MLPRADVRVLASRGASGIDGLVSSAIGAALAHQAAGGGPAVALLGDLALLHDAPGLLLGRRSRAPTCPSSWSTMTAAASSRPSSRPRSLTPFERVFGTPHGADIGALADAAGLPYVRLSDAAGLPDILAGTGLRVVEVRTDRADSAKLRAALGQACMTAISASLLRP